MKKPKGFNIPWIVIILACIVQWPLGIVMILLRELPLKNRFGGKQSDNRSEQSDSSQTVYVSGRGNAVGKTGKTEKKRAGSASNGRKSKTPLLLKLIGGVLLMCGAVMSAEALGDYISFGSMFYLSDLLIGLYFALGGIGCFITSSIFRRREQDESRYAAVIGTKESVSLMKLSAVTSYKIARVRRDLQRMIHRGDFGDAAYIDMANLCFMRSPDAKPDGVAEQYGDAYQRVMTSASPVENEEERTSAAAESVEGISDFDSILKKIRKLDDDIQDEDVSTRIREIEMITRNIFEYVEDKPEKRKQIRMFMNYYLPTTLKLLESYSRIERVGVAGKNMQEAKENIEKILDMLVCGFQQQFDQLFKSESLDISSDIEVLEQMMNKDGLTDTTDFPLCTESYTDGYTDELEDTGGIAARHRTE